MGVFLGDELGWDCVSYANITAAANLVRASLGKEAIIYFNEAFPPFDDIGMWNSSCGPEIALLSEGGGIPRIPDNVDWISIDYYPNEGTFAGTQRIYRERLYPLMAPHQRVLFVPPAYSCSNGSSPAFNDRFCCSNSTRDGANPPCHGDCEAALAGWARATYAWARSDTRFVGINPWHWGQPGMPAPSTWPPGTSMEPGLFWLTKTLRPLWESIGREIVSGRLGDV